MHSSTPSDRPRAARVLGLLAVWAFLVVSVSHAEEAGTAALEKILSDKDGLRQTWLADVAALRKKHHALEAAAAVSAWKEPADEERHQKTVRDFNREAVKKFDELAALLPSEWLHRILLGELSPRGNPARPYDNLLHWLHSPTPVERGALSIVSSTHVRFASMPLGPPGASFDPVQMQLDLKNPALAVYVYCGSETDRGWKIAQAAAGWLAATQAWRVPHASELKPWAVKAKAIGVPFGFYEKAGQELDLASAENLKTVLHANLAAQ